MDLEEKYKRALKALESIADFGHAEGCLSGAPVHECCCFEKDEQQIAKEALEQLGER